MSKRRSDPLTLVPYQEAMLQFMRATPRCNVWADMGLGKTVVSLLRIDELLKAGTPRALVMATPRGVDSTWPNEVLKWDRTRHLRLSFITGKPAKRLAALEAEADVYLIAYPNVNWLFRQYAKRWASWPFPAVFVDESAVFKNHRAIKFKLACKILQYTKYWYNLTGMPASNGLKNLWAQMFLIDAGKRLGRRFSHYLAEFFTQHPYCRFKQDLNPFADEAIYQRVSDVSFSLSTEDYVDLPECVTQPVEVTLPDSLFRKYKVLERKFYLEMAGKPIEAANAAVKSSKCWQFANGASYVSDPDTGARTDEWIPIHDLKLEALKDLITGFNGEPVLIAYSFRSDAERICKAIPEAVMAKDVVGDIETQWNKGELPVLLIYGPEAKGLNLQHGGHYGVWFGATWDLEAWDQFLKRLHRRGQTRPVFIYVIVADGTIEVTEMLPRLDVKRGLHGGLMDATKLIV